MKPYEINKSCPFCQYKVNYINSRIGNDNICPNCNNKIVYSVPIGKNTYHWSKPVSSYGAMDELYKRQYKGD